MLRAVLDTNVVVSAFIERQSPPATILDAWDDDAFNLVVSLPVLAEYRRVLRYDKLQPYLYFTTAEIDAMIEQFEHAGTLVTSAQPLHVVHDDPTDNVFLECAVAGGADYLVSGDRHLLTLGRYSDIVILRPSDFVRDVLSQTEEDPEDR